MSDVVGDSPGPAAADPVDGSWRVVEAVEGWMVEHPTKPPVGPLIRREVADVVRKALETNEEMPAMSTQDTGNRPENAAEARYRVGRHLGRTLYRDDELIGLMDSAVDAQMVIDALNAPSEVERLRKLVGDENQPAWGNCSREEAIRQANEFHAGQLKWLLEHDKRRDERDDALEQVRLLRARIAKVRGVRDNIECSNCDHPAKFHGPDGRCTDPMFSPASNDGQCSCTWGGGDIVAQLDAALCEREPVLSTQPGSGISVEADFECETQPEGRPSIDT